MITGTSAQLNGSGMDVSVRLDDPDAKVIMNQTPNVVMTFHGNSYKVHEMNPTIVPNVYRVRLCESLLASIPKDATVTFE